MDLGLGGKAAIVTGGSRGIGRATALRLAGEGAHVAICARGAAELRATAEQIRALGVKAFAASVDVRDAAALDVFLDEAHAALGRVDALVNNASALAMGGSEADWRSGFEIDLMPCVRASQKVVPWLRERGGGAIVHVSTTAALEAPTPPAYSALKAALISFSKNQAVELAPDNIRVNCVAPGCIEFPGGLWAQVHRDDPAAWTRMVETIPGGRMGTAEEVADVIVFALSERASWLRGALVCVDGAQHKGNL
jgi:NAD(P)-dependent dehydrogenase (short-subunit alcohol dehydrogenase family)